MTECKQYLAVLEESLRKKIELLNGLASKNEDQAEAVKADEMDRFDLLTEEKTKMIEELNSLDNGFNLIYDKISKELQQNKVSYAKEIQILKELIAEITDKSMQVQTSEHRNRLLIEQYFTKAKQEIKKSKTGLKTASDYYKNMSKVDYTTPHMMDQKK